MSLATLREHARRIQAAVLAAADPGGAVTRSLAREDLSGRQGRLFLVAVGKAGAGMMRAALDTIGAEPAAGIAVLPHGYPGLAPADPRVIEIAAGHPVPDQGSITAAQAVTRLVDGMAKPDLCMLLLSGGGSSLLSLPHPPLTLADLVQTGHLLLASGADIAEVNTVRRHLSALSGGRLAERCRGTILTLAVSDVIGDELHAIASGPTVADPTTFADAAAVLERRRLMERVPGAVVTRIREGAAGRLPDTPKAVAPRHRAAVIASGRAAVDAAAGAARAAGFTPRILTDRLSGEARDAGRFLACEALAARADTRALPACLIAAGETTVTVRGSGKGGRNQEIALAAALELAGTPGILLTSFATDGKEGNTDAAGAFASSETIARGKAAGLDPGACLAANDSNAFLAAAGELIVTGPTGTNVNDISFILVEKGAGRG